MEKARRILLIEFWLPIAISLVMVVLFENDILLPGKYAVDKVMEYYVAIAMELATICLIPISLRLFKFKKVKSFIEEKSFGGLIYWGSYRMNMLVVPMMFNTLFYYLFMNVAFGYMGIIGLLCMVFIYPSKARCKSEVE